MSLPPKRRNGPPPPPKKPLPVHIQCGFGLFQGQDSGTDKKYTEKIEAPIYIPKGKRPNIIELVDLSRTKKLIEKINSSKLSRQEKDFLTAAAYRHAKFFYKKIADYYSHSSKEAQILFEASALVIIDFDEAIKHGYVKLSREITELYEKEHQQKQP